MVFEYILKQHGMDPKKDLKSYKILILVPLPPHSQKGRPTIP